MGEEEVPFPLKNMSEGSLRIASTPLPLEAEVLEALPAPVLSLLQECYDLRAECHRVNDTLNSLDAVVLKHSTIGLVVEYGWDGKEDHPTLVLLERPHPQPLPSLLDTYQPLGTVSVVRVGSALLRAPELEERYASRWEYTSLRSMRRVVGLQPPSSSESTPPSPSSPDDLWPLCVESALHLTRNKDLLEQHLANYRAVLGDFNRLLATVQREEQAKANAQASLEAANAAMKQGRGHGAQFMKPQQGTPLLHFNDTAADLSTSPTCKVVRGGVGAVRAEPLLSKREVYTWSVTILGAPQQPNSCVLLGVAPESCIKTTPQTPFELGTMSTLVSLAGERFHSGGVGAVGVDDLSFLSGKTEVALQLDCLSGTLSVKGAEEGGIWVCVASGLPTQAYAYAVSRVCLALVSLFFLLHAHPNSPRTIHLYLLSLLSTLAGCCYIQGRSGAGV